MPDPYEIDRPSASSILRQRYGQGVFRPLERLPVAVPLGLSLVCAGRLAHELLLGLTELLLRRRELGLERADALGAARQPRTEIVARVLRLGQTSLELGGLLGGGCIFGCLGLSQRSELSARRR